MTRTPQQLERLLETASIVARAADATIASLQERITALENMLSDDDLEELAMLASMHAEDLGTSCNRDWIDSHRDKYHGLSAKVSAARNTRAGDEEKS